MKPILHLASDPLSNNTFEDVNRGVVPSFSRTSIATGEDNQGNQIIVGSESLRFRKLGNKYYIALEPVATNYVTNSEDIAKWVPDSANFKIYSKTQVGPTGDIDADEVVYDAVTGYGITLSGLGNLNSQVLTYSVWMKAASGTPTIRMMIASTNVYTSNKVITTSWVRYTFTQAMVVGDVASVFLKLNANDTSAPTVYIYGVQLEARTFPSSYLPTTPKNPYNPNLVIDGDMEFGDVASWTAYNGATLSKDTSNAKFGRQSLKIVNTVTGFCCSQSITTVSGATYRLSAWTYNDTSSGQAAVATTNPTASPLNVLNILTWNYNEYTFKATSTTSLLQFGFNTAGTIHIDRVSVTRQMAPEPSLEATIADTYVTFPRGAQISGNNYANYNPNQGTISFWFKPNWVGNDGVQHVLFYDYDATGCFSIKKRPDSVIEASFAATALTLTCDVTGWTSGAWHLVTVRWDCDSPVTGTSRIEIFIDGVTVSNAGSSNIVPAAPQTAITVGLGSGTTRHSADGTFDDFAIWDRVLTATEITAIYNAGTGAACSFYSDSSLKIYFPFDNATGNVVSGILSAQGCSAGVLQLPVASGGQNMVINPHFEVDTSSWAASSSTISRKTDTASMLGMYDLGCLEVTAAGPATGNGQQTITGLTAGADYYFSVFMKSGTASCRAMVWSGTSGAPTTTSLFDTSILVSTNGIRVEGCVRIPSGHDRVVILLYAETSTTGQTAYFDNVVFVPNKVVNGGMAGTYAAGLAPGFASVGSPTNTESSDSHGLDSKAQTTTGVYATDYLRQTVTIVNATWYLASGWTKRLSGAGFTRISLAGVVFHTSSTSTYTRGAAIFKSTGVAVNVDLLGEAGTVGIYDDISLLLLASVDLTVSIAPGAAANAVQFLAAKLSNGILMTASELPSPWEQNGLSGLIQESTSFHSGTQALRVTADAIEGLRLSQTTVALSVSTWYQISVWIYIVSQSSAAIVPQLAAEAPFNNGVVATQNAKPTIGSWQKLTMTVKTAASIPGATYIYVNQNLAGSCVFIVDDFSIVQLVAPATVRTSEFLSLPLTNKQPSNLIKYSEQLDNVAGWAYNGSVPITANNTTAPDGTLTADLATFNVATYILPNSIAVKINTSYVGSVWMKSPNGPTDMIIYFDDGVATLALKMCPVTTSWKRFFVQGPSTAASVLIRMLILNQLPTNKVWIWGAQIEEGTYPGKYIKTEAQPITPVFTGGIASPNIIERHGSISFFMYTPATKATGSTYFFGEQVNHDFSIFSVNPSTTNWTLRINGRDKAGVHTYQAITIPNTSNISDTVEHMVVVCWGTEYDSAGRFVLSRVSVYIDGVKQVETTSTTVQSYDIYSATFTISDGLNTNAIRDLKIWPGPLTPSEVTELYVAG